MSKSVLNGSRCHASRGSWPLLLALGCAALTACSQRSEPDAAGSRETRSLDVAADNAAMAAPGIDVTAAPGVAFTYRYGFRLPSARISSVQEAHAQACEKLGVARCRIVGMRYRLLGENNVEAGLDFKLAPELARAFGKNGIAAVQEASGTLVDAEITGTDAGTTVDRAGVERARASDEVSRLDALIAKARTATERAELQAQRAAASGRANAARDTAADARDSLAQTPVAFIYGSGPAVRGFDSSAPITSALDTAVVSAQVTLAILLGVCAIFGPPALVVGLVLLLFPGVRRWWRRRRNGTPAG